MKPFFSLVIISSVISFSQTVIFTETFPINASSGNRVVRFRIVDMTGKIILQQQNKNISGATILQMNNSEELTTVKFNIAR
jgi:hypothetical protein